MQSHSERKRCMQHGGPQAETIINLDEAQETQDRGTFSPPPSRTSEPQLGNINNFPKWIAVQRISSCQHLKNGMEWPGSWDMKIKERNHMEFLSYHLSRAPWTPPHRLAPNEENIDSKIRRGCFISFVKRWGQWDYKIPPVLIPMSRRPLFILCLHSII